MLETVNSSRYTPDLRYFSQEEETVLFFDIETTGLSPEKSHLYLIGCAYRQNGTFVTRQWFAEDSSQEFAILESFLDLAKDFRLLISYNGATFDLPYLRKKCRAYQLSEDPLSIPMADLFRIISPYRNLFSLKHLHQTDLERFLGLYRQDCYNGKELIAVYEKYRRSPEPRLLDALLLHNREDIDCMLYCTKSLAYPCAFEGRFQYEDGSCDGKRCTFRFRLEVTVPTPLSVKHKMGSFRMENQSLTVSISSADGTIPYFHSDYEHYVWLAGENTLMEKRLARLLHLTDVRPADLYSCYEAVSVTKALLSDGDKAKQLSIQFFKWLLRVFS